jgi:hypothetical protein
LGREAAGLQCFPDGGHHVSASKLHGRQIDGHRDGGVALRLPCLCLAAGLVENPAPDRHDQPAFLGEGDEAARWNAAQHAIEPAQQGFHADDASAGQIDLGLVVKAELLVVEGLAQGVFQLKTLQRVDVHDLVEEPIGVTPALLGVVHGGIGILHEALGTLPVIGKEGNADGEGGCQ